VKKAMKVLLRRSDIGEGRTSFRREGINGIRAGSPKPKTFTHAGLFIVV